MKKTPKTAPVGAMKPYAVGKNRPPEHSRWRRGESGNKRTAQPPLTIRTAALERVLAREIEVHVAGKATWMPLGDAVLLRLTERGVMEEDGPCLLELTRLMGEAEKQRVEEAARQADRSRRCAERRRAREAERAAAWARGEPQNASPFFDMEGTPAQEALTAMDALFEDEDGQLRVRAWVWEAANERAPEMADGLSLGERAAISEALESGAEAAGDERPPWERWSGERDEDAAGGHGHGRGDAEDGDGKETDDDDQQPD